MIEINKVAVIGSGVMGASIAAHIANSGTPVILLDIVPEDADNRNQLAENAIERLKKADPAPLTHKKKAALITAGNLEDDLEQLKDVDWIIEAVLEDVEIKRSLYVKVNNYRKEHAVISSNTSTIPLAHLTDGMPEPFKRHFMITHFFNPPRYMRLLELVESPQMNEEAAQAVRHFADVKLGKGVVDCNDTPGFIANRIGCYWMMAGVIEAIETGITVEQADAVMSRPIGVPKTGVFGLLDLIGIDLMPLIAKAFSQTLPKDDPFLVEYKEPEIVTKMIEDGYTGRKGKGGFYRLNKEGGKKVKEAKNLQKGNYASADKPKLQSVDAAKGGLRKLIEHDDIGGKYANIVLLKTLSYAASLIPEIADEVKSVDKAMRLGYNWKYGPFELIDRLGGDDMSGTQYLAKRLEENGLPVPEFLERCAAMPLYHKDHCYSYYMDKDGGYQQKTITDDKWTLADKKISQTPILKNASAALWDVGDGIVCLEYTSKMNSVDPMILEMIEKTTELVAKDYKGLIIGNDADNFCVGANIGILLFAANVAAWKDIRGIIKQGQDAYMGLKYAPFPVVTAVTGMALGGGCEILMHSDAVQAHVETYTGLVEVGVGIVPGWGGCKEMLLRHVDARQKDQGTVAKMGRMFSALSLVKTANTMPAVSKAFEYIATAKVAKSAEEAKDMLILRDSDAITMNRERLLADAKATCLKLAQNYEPPESPSIHLPGKTARTALGMAISGFVKSGKATEYDEVVSKALAEVLSGGNTDITKEITEQQLLDLELDIFMELVKNKGTMDRLEYMLEVGKPLRN